MPIDKLKNKFFIGSWVNDVKQYFTKINEIIDHLNSTTPVTTKECVIFLEQQTGTSDPIYTIISNTLDVTPVITRDDVGTYWVTAAGCFTNQKTICSADNKTASNFGKFIIQRATDDIVSFVTYDSTETEADNEILFNWIKITVYP